MSKRGRPPPKTKTVKGNYITRTTGRVVLLTLIVARRVKLCITNALPDW